MTAIGETGRSGRAAGQDSFQPSAIRLKAVIELN
jgi:hypothetical protein